RRRPSRRRAARRASGGGPAGHAGRPGRCRGSRRGTAGARWSWLPPGSGVDTGNLSTIAEGNVPRSMADLEAMDTSERLLKLLSLLQARPDWTGQELAERLEGTGRTVRNDRERLARPRFSVPG